MPSLDEFDIIVGGVNLVNTWRKTTTGIVVVRDSLGVAKVAGVEFVIEADTEAQLSDRLDATMREFNKRNVEMKGFRSTEADVIFHWYSGDGETQDIQCVVTMLPQMETKNSYYMYLEITANLVLNVPPGGGTLRPTDEIEGLVGQNVQVVEVHEAGETTTISASGAFQTILADEDLGPFTITQIIDDTAGGTSYIRVQLATTPTGVIVGDYATLTGTTTYNGQHEVVDVDGNDLVLNYPYIIDDTSGGTCNVGEIKLARALLDAAKPAIMTLMGVGSNNLTLTHRTINDLGDGVAEFNFVAQEQDFVPGGIGDGDTQLVRAIQMRIAEQSHQGLELNSAVNSFGAADYGVMVAEGQVVLNRDSASFVDDLETLWTSTIRADILTRIVARTGASSITVTFEDISIDITTPAINFTITAVDSNFNNALVLEYNRSQSVVDEPWIYSKGNGLHGIQFEAAPPIATLVRVVVRVGVAQVDLSTLAAPTEAGYSFHLHSYTDDERGPIRAGELTNVYMQKRTETWLRYKTS